MARGRAMSGFVIRSGRVKTATRPAPKRPPTKELLIATAESLFGRHGIDGISLREIAAAAGQANSTVVQYHFKDKSGLVSAILEDRVLRMEALRSQWLQGLTAAEKTPREFLKIIWLPVTTVRDDDGNHTFCRFLLQYMLQPTVALHPIAKLYTGANVEETTAGKDLPSLVKSLHLLWGYYEHLPRATFFRRLSALSVMFLAAVVQHDKARQPGGKGAASEFDIDPILDMVVGALSAPHG
jgi:AcrR family transcriptional regulator